MNDLFQRLRKAFQDKTYRHVYANGFIDSKIATQLKVLRELFFGTQEHMAEETGMRQARISVLEDVNYSSWSINTLRRYAKAFDLYVDVEFKEFGTLERQLEEISREHLSRRRFSDDPVFQEMEHPRTAAQTEILGRAVLEAILNLATPTEPAENLAQFTSAGGSPTLKEHMEGGSDFVKIELSPKIPTTGQKPSHRVLGAEMIPIDVAQKLPMEQLVPSQILARQANAA